MTADFVGVPPEQLRDSAMLSGLLIAAAGAAGFGSIGLPTVRVRGETVGAIILLDGCHVSAHAYAERGLLLFDALAPSQQDAKRALDVFTRRLTAREVRVDVRTRG